MKLKIDFDTKKITLEQEVNLSKFIEMVPQLIPNYRDEDWTLEAVQTIVHTTPPIVVDPWIKPWWQQPSYHEPFITSGTTGPGSPSGEYIVDIR